MDGVDVALIRTNGITVKDTGEWLTIPFAEKLQRDIYAAAKEADINKVEVFGLERELTLKHAEAVEALLAKSSIKREEVAVIGFHGQTILHAPINSVSWQIGDGNLLAEKTGIDVVTDFRRRDIAAGGHGAPLVPMFNLALIKKIPKPLAILNIGGVANVAYHGENPEDILAFDTGPGGALLNDFVNQKTGALYDTDGILSSKGKANEAVVAHYMAQDFFRKKPPKSLDRNSFTLTDLPGMSLEDGAATLAEITVQAVARASQHFPKPVKAWYITGGGRYNKHMMKRLGELLQLPVHKIEKLGANGDALEAQAFAYLAMRALKGLPLSLPTTTGVSRPVIGGALYRA